MYKQRVISAMPLISLLLFLFSGFVLDDWILGLTFFALIPFSTLLLSSNPLKRIVQSMPITTTIVFLWLALGLDMAHPGWLVFLLIPLSDMLYNGKLEPRKLISVFTTAVFLIIGFVYDAWHPGWLVFLLIPILNILFFPKMTFSFNHKVFFTQFSDTFGQTNTKNEHKDGEDIIIDDEPYNK
jgi:hypothetical protein